MNRILCLAFLLVSTQGNPEPADQTSNGPPPSATPAPIADAERPPLWRVYYDRGIKAMRDKDYDLALDQLDKAKHSLTNDHDANDPALLAEIYTQIGYGLLEQGLRANGSSQRESLLMYGRQHFGQARKQIDALHGADSLEFADATERFADARSIYAEDRNGELRAYLNALAPDSTSKESVAELYLLTLTVREQRLGETDRDVMTYRRKVLRQFRAWIRTANTLRRDVTDIAIQYECDPVIANYKTQAETLKQRDRALSSAADANTNGN